MGDRWLGGSAAVVVALAACVAGTARAADAAPTLEQALSYPFVSDLVAAEHADRIAWVQDVRGARNVWVADGPGFAARQVAAYRDDDGQEITGLTFSPDGATLVYVRGGDHDANWAADKTLAPDPAASPQEPKVTLWRASLSGGAPVKLGEGDFPALSSKGVLAYVKDDQVWTVGLDGKDPHRLAFDRGKDSALAWSPDGSRLAFVSDRGDHAFITVFGGADVPLTYLAPSTGRDGDPVWSPDGSALAFTRQPGEGGAPEPLLVRVPHPFAIWTADAATGRGRQVWRSPDTLDGSYPDSVLGVNLTWMAGQRLVFTAALDGWQHLYVLPVAGGEPRLLTPGRFMVEQVVAAKDRRTVLYDANTGADPADSDRRHLYRLDLDGTAPRPLSGGDTIETSPVAASATQVGYIAWGARRPAAVAVASQDGAPGHLLQAAAGASDAYPASALVTPKLVSFTAPDGTPLQGQLFQAAGGPSRKPGVIFVHGGPPRQMLLGWHYMGYYSNAYALNQYLAAHGFVVLSVNYRLGIGYGRAFQQPPRAGFAGASEYQDVLAGARFLQAVPGVDPARIGIWGGSYGGLLTALALARNSDVFKAGVDFHGVHDWSRDLAEFATPPTKRYEQGDWAEAMKVAFVSSPDADIKTWRSPVLLIQGDDDRNVRFSQTVDLARRLDAQGVRYEELVIPNEIHGFLRYDSWLRADAAAAEFLARELGADLAAGR